MEDNDTFPDDPQTEAAAVADIVARYIKPELLELEHDGPKVLLVPTGFKAQSIKEHLDQYLQAPERKQGTSRHVELASFIDIVNRFSNPESVLFAQPDPKTPTLLAVFDYHESKQGSPRFGKHRALYTFPLSEEWIAWSTRHGQTMAQLAFAEFVDDRLIDVADPAQAFSNAKRLAESLGIPSFASPSQLLTLSRGLSIHEASRAVNKINPSTGETTMIYEVEHQTEDKGAPLAVPRAFIIQIPVFRGGTAYQLPVRLKYRLGGGKVSWLYEIHDAKRAFDDAFREACELAHDKTELPLFYGSPEAP